GGISQNRRSRHARRDFFEQLEPLGGDGVLERGKSGRIASRMRQGLNEPGANRVDRAHEYDRHGAGRLLQRGHDVAGRGEDDIRRERGELGCVTAGTIGITCGPANVEVHITTINPAQFLQPLLKCRKASLPFRIILGEVHENANSTRSRTLLRARYERPRSCSAEQRDELAAPHSITSSARASSVAGTSRPSALAVLRLITSSYLVGACTGRSAGFSPLRMRSM